MRRRDRSLTLGETSEIAEDIMIRNHPVRSLSTLAVLTAVLFVCSASGNSTWFSGPKWLGNVGWAGFLLGILALIGAAIYLSVSRIRQRAR
jgi:protein-S-isoprenylcysteine O-methyltransferase Ste14